VPLKVSAIMIGVEDLARSKKFYGEGLGCTIEHDYPNFVSFNLGDGSSSLALYERDAAAHDARRLSEGSGFRGVSFH
jgi:catechol 2,3-dioxygenase-like lactoylglutathione lyase family enzyme